MFSDWLQGPYVYALYSSYGFSSAEIAQFFVAGFGSSMVIGTFVGSLSDKYGRKTMCLVFVACYIASALTKLSHSYWVLMFGRVFSGVATSLLFSAFEAWMVCEHNKRGFSPALLSDTFSKATAGNGIIAVLAGLTSSFLADNFGYVVPFLFAIVPLTTLSIPILTSWTENYGDNSVPVSQTFKSAITFLKASPSTLLLGLAQSTFEGAMYAFVFMWTPALTATRTGAIKSLPFGVIFATFMVAVMVGSYTFSILTSSRPVASMPYLIHTVSAVTMAGVAFFTQSELLTSVCFLAFEAMCGMFWPTYGTLRSQYIPEASRAAISNLFRVPLNAFVLGLLLNSGRLATGTMFLVCAGAHMCSLVMYSVFQRSQVAAASAAAKQAGKGKKE